MKKVLASVAMVLAATASHASPYVLIAGGVSDHDIDCTDTLTCDKRGTGFKLFGGYKLTPNFAIEGGYLGFGKSEATAVDETGTAEVDGFGVGAAFHHDLTPDWSLVGRLGLASMDVKVDGTILGSRRFSQSDSSTQLYGGVELGWRIQPNVTLGASYDFSRGELQNSKLDVQMLSVSMTVAF